MKINNLKNIILHFVQKKQPSEVWNFKKNESKTILTGLEWIPTAGVQRSTQENIDGINLKNTITLVLNNSDMAKWRKKYIKLGRGRCLDF